MLQAVGVCDQEKQVTLSVTQTSLVETMEETKNMVSIDMEMLAAESKVRNRELSDFQGSLPAEHNQFKEEKMQFMRADSGGESDEGGLAGIFCGFCCLWCGMGRF
jgi:hypothetical protein